jgi:hypothetical protein
MMGGIRALPTCAVGGGGGSGRQAALGHFANTINSILLKYITPLTSVGSFVFSIFFGRFINQSKVI